MGKPNPPASQRPDSVESDGGQPCVLFTPPPLLTRRSHPFSMGALRRARSLKSRVRRVLRLDVPHLSPRAIVGLQTFRLLTFRVPPAETPEELLTFVSGTVVELSIADIFPLTTCFVQADVSTVAIRWSEEWFISLHAVEDVMFQRRRAGRRNPMFNFKGPVGKSSSPRSTSREGSNARSTSGTRRPLRTQASASSVATRRQSSKAIPKDAGVGSSRRSDSAALARKLSAMRTGSQGDLLKKPSFSMLDVPLKKRLSAGGEAVASIAAAFEDAPRQLLRKISALTTTVASEVCITFSSDGGVMRDLRLIMPESDAVRWVVGVQTLRDAIPRLGSPAHGRWVLSCMSATSRRGATGSLREVDIRSLLNRANASARLSSTSALEAAVRHVTGECWRSTLPSWLQAGEFNPSGHHDNVLSLPQLTSVLLQLCTSSACITRLFDRYATDGHVNQTGWMNFERKEQTAPGDDILISSAAASPCDEHDGGSLMTDHGDLATGEPSTMPLVRFALKILNADNNAVKPAPDLDASDGVHGPIAHHWIATSHNSYIVGAFGSRKFDPGRPGIGSLKHE